METGIKTPLRQCAAIFQHAATTPLCQYPRTRLYTLPRHYDNILEHATIRHYATTPLSPSMPIYASTPQCLYPTTPLPHYLRAIYHQLYITMPSYVLSCLYHIVVSFWLTSIFSGIHFTSADDRVSAFNSFLAYINLSAYIG